MNRTILLKAVCWLASKIAPALVKRLQASTEAVRESPSEQRRPYRGLLYVIDKSFAEEADFDRVNKPSCQGHAYENVPITTAP
jgi:hypothetical protein